MDTLNGLSFEEVGKYRNIATELFWTKERWNNLTKLIGTSKGITRDKKQSFKKWNDRSNDKIYSDIEMPAENNVYS